MHPQDGGRPIEGTILDVSFGGMYVETYAKAPAVDTAVSLHFQHPANHEHHDYQLSAVVVRNDADGVGLMFEDYDDHTIESLRRVYLSTVSP